MKNFIFDACSLIYLTKIKVKEKLPSLGKITISLTVKKELIADIEKYSEASILKKNIDIQMIKESKKKIEDIWPSKNLGKGEKEAIELCTKGDGILVTDDHKAFNFALSLGLKPKTSEIILLILLEVGVINYEEFIKYFEELAIIKSLKIEIISFFKEKAKDLINSRKEVKEND